MVVERWHSFALLGHGWAEYAMFVTIWIQFPVISE